MTATYYKMIDGHAEYGIVKQVQGSADELQPLGTASDMGAARMALISLGYEVSPIPSPSLPPSFRAINV